MKAIYTCFLLFLQLVSLAQVPAQWQVAYPQLISKLNTLVSQADTKWDGKPYCTDFAGNLLLANSNRGYLLFSPAPPNGPVKSYQDILFAKIDTMLMAYDTLGYKAVDISIQYPLLVPSFPNSQNYLKFYKKVFAMAKAHGFHIIEGCQAAFVDTTFGEPYMSADVKKYYFNPDGNPATDDTLDATRYKQDKLQMMQIIIDSLKPDYLTIEMEPQTQEANLFNLVSFSQPNVLSYLNYFVTNLNSGTTLLGAGAGTWDGLGFFTGIAGTAIDYIDYHVYPVNLSTALPTVFKIDSIADANGKKLVIGEAWCYKASDNEIQSNAYGASAPAIYYSRDPFTYWEGVDTLFVRALVKLSQQSKIEMVSFFWSYVMFGQLVYNSSYASMTPKQVINAGQQYALGLMSGFNLGTVGIFTKKEIAVDCSLVGINEEFITKPTLAVYPNPGSSTFTLEGILSTKKVSLCDVAGKIIITYYPRPGETTFSLPEGIAQGLYILHADTENGRFTTRLAITR